MIAGVGMAIMLVKMLSISVMCGLNSALGTFVSQSYGQNNLRLCGQYLNTARLITLIY